MGASIEASVSEGVPELSQGINYSCRIMPQSGYGSPPERAGIPGTCFSLTQSPRPLVLCILKLVTFSELSVMFELRL